MEQKPVRMNESPEFLCPSCGTSAFEIVGRQWGLSDEDSGEEFLVMRCLDCLELFYHQIGSEEPHGMPSEGNERIPLASSAVGSSPSLTP